MPANEKRREERKTLSRAQAWKEGLVGGRAWKWKAGGRGRGRGGGFAGGGGRGGRGGGGGSDKDAPVAHELGAPGTASAPAAAADADDDASDSDPVARLGARDPFEALMASLRADGDMDAGTSSDESSDGDDDGGKASDGEGDDDGAVAGGSDDMDDNDTDDDDEEEEEEGEIEGIVDEHGNPVAMEEHVEGSEDEDGSQSDDDDGDDEEAEEEEDSDGIPNADPTSDDEAPAEEGDEEDEVATDDDSDDFRDDDKVDGGEVAASGATRSSVAAPGADHSLAMHLRRTVTQDAADAVALTAPRFKPVTGDGDGEKKKDDAGAGRWEADKTALEDARDRVAPVINAPPPRAPVGLPAKLKERWNALYDPAGAAALNKRFKREKTPGGKGESKGVKDEEAKARRARAIAAAETASFKSTLQCELFALMDGYRDVVYTARKPPGSAPKEPVGPDGSGGGGDDVMDAYLLHVVNHVMRTRTRITKNNESLLKRSKAKEIEMDIAKNAEREAAAAAEAKARAEGKDGKTVKAEAKKAAWEAKKAAAIAKRKGKKATRVMVEDDLPRDQGFVRPTVLILVPMRNVAGRVVRRLLQMCPAAQGRADAVNKLDRFAEDFGDGDSDVEPDDVDQSGQSGGAKRRRGGGQWIPDDHKRLFRGNTDDHFRLGIKVTKASVRLYVDFFGSDILVCSPLGLVTKLQESGKSAADFLASIELLVVDNADVLAMQNWQHVLTLFSSCNQLPKDQHGVDIMRVHESHLNGLARNLRQTIVLSSFPCAEINALVRNECANLAGRVRWKESFPGVLGWAARAVRNAGGLRQQFERLPDAASIADSDDVRFKHFTRRVLPRLRENPAPGALIFIRDYLDFVRVRNLLTAEDVSFAVTSEYTDPRDAARARSIFADGRKRVLLVTERAHFYFRRRIRGVREVHFYSLPDHAGFYAEMLGFLGDGDGRSSASTASAPSATAVFSRLDALRLERVCGSARAKKMLAPDANSTFIFTA